MNRTKKLLQLALLIGIGLYLFPLVKERFAFAGAPPALHQAAPDFTLTGMSGNQVRLADYRGKVVLVNFFASWCPPCRMEIPGFQKTYAAYQGRGFTVIGVALDDVPPSFLKRMGITYPVALGNESVFNAYGDISSVPVSFLIGRNGKVVKKVMGYYLESSLKGDIEKALAGKI
ncbi:TlpA family protein disulfide reductase [Geomonas sp. Red32]|uniref:TlpA disulfide reductase family protein n=1 Tax=Geomonas sp. Red32 TaxID=2912856 RepID=UPI00202CAF9A|nr:TlpA disulfide reductase family protein [Geomonas sp. Red32]MCM0082278.1 TlpA family protein disulfide reductase [Geomonas sp. Red32]